MATKTTKTRASMPVVKPVDEASTTSIDDQVAATLDWLKRNGSQAGLDAMARYAIASNRAFGVSVGALRDEAKRLGRNHEFAAGLWATGFYEARMLATFVDEPERVTAAQMERWCRDFDNWAICDTACFALFDRTPHAWAKVEQWAKQPEEFVKRGAFALLWSLAAHRKGNSDLFVESLALIEREATDERNFVKKAVNMALRAIGKRNVELNAAAVALAKRLAASTDATARWVGKDALRELTGASVSSRLAAKSSATPKAKG